MSPVTQRVYGLTVWMVFLQYHATLRGGAELLSVELQVDGEGEEGEQCTGLRLGEGTDFGDGVG